VMVDLAGVLGADDAPGALFDLATAIGAPTSLDAIGMPADGLDEAARRVVADAAGNVRVPELDGIRRLLDDAFHGRRPTAAVTDDQLRPWPRTGASTHASRAWAVRERSHHR
jgi:maleylacetate reductase